MTDKTVQFWGDESWDCRSASQLLWETTPVMTNDRQLKLVRACGITRLMFYIPNCCKKCTCLPTHTASDGSGVPGSGGCSVDVHWKLEIVSH